MALLTMGDRSSKSIVVLGSSRSNGNTRKALDTIVDTTNIKIVDLNTLTIKPFDYEYKNQSDDFIPLIEDVLSYEKIILATPVYWYTMSATMKAFVDRLSDLLEIRKDLGRRLRGKQMFIIATYRTSIPRGFEDTFQQTCEYLGIKYLGTSFIYSGTEQVQFLANNTVEISKAKEVLS